MTKYKDLYSYADFKKAIVSSYGELTYVEVGPLRHWQ